MINNPKIIQKILERLNSIPAEDIKKALYEAENPIRYKKLKIDY